MHLAFFFFNDTATTEIYTLSLHDALPICWWARQTGCRSCRRLDADVLRWPRRRQAQAPSGDEADLSGRGRSGRDQLRCDLRSEEHTSELQSRQYLVCRLLLEKKKRLSIYA